MDEEVRAIGEDRKEEGEGVAVTEVGGDPRTIGGEASKCSKGPLGKGTTAGEVGRRGKVGDEPVTKPPELRGRVKKLAIEGYWRRSTGSGGVPLHRGTPVYELHLGN